MSLYFKLYKAEIFRIVAGAILLMWALTASIIAVKKDLTFKVLYATSDKIEVLDEDSSKLDNVFLQNFIFTYVSYCYNYDRARFAKNVGKCGDFMHPKLWAAKQSELQLAIDEMKRADYTLSTFILNTPQILANGDIQIDVKSTKTNSVGQSTLNIRVTLKVKKIPLLLENMTHYEVQNAKEEII